jgi:hypothetical protein
MAPVGVLAVVGTVTHLVGQARVRDLVTGVRLLVRGGVLPVELICHVGSCPGAQATAISSSVALIIAALLATSQCGHHPRRARVLSPGPDRAPGHTEQRDANQHPDRHTLHAATNENFSTATRLNSDFKYAENDPLPSS